MTPEDFLPERRLMQAVILNAIGDATGRKSDNRRPNHVELDRRDAIRWFTEAGADFRDVCEIAGIHPDTVAMLALAFIESKEPMPRVMRQAGTFERDPMSDAAIAAHAGVSVSAVRGVLKYGIGSAAMKARVHATIEDLATTERLAA